MAKDAFKINGLDCAEEVAVLKKTLEPIAGIQSLGFDILNAKMTVTYDAGKVSAEQIVTGVKTTGMKADPWTDDVTKQKPETFWAKNLRAFLTGASALAIVLGFVFHPVPAGFSSAFRDGESAMPLVSKVFYLLAVATGIWFVLPKAWISVKRLSPDMNLLMVLAVAGAIAINQWFEGATVAFLFSLSLVLEALERGPGSSRRLRTNGSRPAKGESHSWR